MSWEEKAPDGVCRIEGANVVFLEPCRIISSYYSHFCVLPHRYYSRSFFFPRLRQQASEQQQKKRKRKKAKVYVPNPKELLAEGRHKDIRKLILDAHTTFLASPRVFPLLKSLESALHEHEERQYFLNGHHQKYHIDNDVIDFAKLGDVWQAPLYEITLSRVNENDAELEGLRQENGDFLKTVSLFKHIIYNNSNEELLGSCANTTVILPKKSCFFMSDFRDIQQTLQSDGYNLIIIDPPWENKSVHRHTPYSTLPNRYLLSLPISKYAHSQGALIGLWVTNREKLRAFVEDELFPAWRTCAQTVWFWLKIKSDGRMITELDMPHHKPYECLLLGYISSQDNRSDPQICVPKVPPDKQVLISIPGDHSRKPPLASLLSEYVPGEPVRGLELFARDMHPGWTSWGNEPLKFQQIPFFCKKQNKY